MKIISHRGNIDSSSVGYSYYENSIDKIKFILEKTQYDIEIDIRITPVNGELSMWTGHDYPVDKLTEEIFTYLSDYHERLWIHAKDLATLSALIFVEKEYKKSIRNNSFKESDYANYFYHNTDDYTLTSNHYIWTYFNKEVGDRSVIVVADEDITRPYLSSLLKRNCYAICTDKPYQAQIILDNIKEKNEKS